MSRSAKFRAWHKEIGQYRAIDAIEFDDNGNPFFITTLNATTGTDSMTEPIESVVLEQWTGLLDRNGKKIYEGDIFRNNINGGTWRVYWNEKDAGFWVDSGVSGCSLGDFDWSRNNMEWGFIKKNCEVIGNIHEPSKDFSVEYLKTNGHVYQQGRRE